MKKLAFVYNPNAGKGKVITYLTDIIRVFTKGNYSVTLFETKRKNHCREYITDEGKNFDVVVVAGGDGTINEAFNALVPMGEGKPSLGYIPMGTTNDFAQSCLIPLDAIDAARCVMDGREIEIDAGKFNDKYFSYVAAFGIFTSVAYDTPQDAKNLFGRAAYIVEGIKNLSNVKSCRMRVVCDEKEIEGDFIFGMVANSNSVGGLNIKNLEVDLSDGLFEVFLLKKIDKGSKINEIIVDLLNKNRDSEHYYIFKSDRIEFITEDNVNWTLDGEYGGEDSRIKIENMHRAIKIRVADSEEK